ncbi:MAG: hypothetical protein IBJ00_07260 [Alphaproteobacteria bacterium]|nr:hypothetical protein [Alphaproteobacteria bacterium]
MSLLLNLCLHLSKTEVRYLHDNIIIKKAGKPIAVLIDMALFEKIKNLQPQSENSAELEDSIAS